MPSPAKYQTEESILQNRAYVAKSRAKKEGLLWAWPTFADWKADFDKIRPENFSVQTHRIHFDRDRFAEYSPRTMVIIDSSKALGRRQERASALTEVALTELDQRVVLASELSLRLLAYTEGTSFAEILRDSLAAAGMRY